MITHVGFETTLHILILQHQETDLVVTNRHRKRVWPVGFDFCLMRPRKRGTDCYTFHQY